MIFCCSCNQCDITLVEQGLAADIAIGTTGDRKLRAGSSL